MDQARKLSCRNIGINEKLLISASTSWSSQTVGALLLIFIMLYRFPDNFPCAWTIVHIVLEGASAHRCGAIMEVWRGRPTSERQQWSNKRNIVLTRGQPRAYRMNLLAASAGMKVNALNG